MFAYILRDVKSALKKKYTLWYVVGFFFLVLAANFSMMWFRRYYGMNDGSFGENLILFAKEMLWIPYYSTIFIADIIFGKEYPNPHIKDKTTIKMKRYQIYLSKLVGSVILSFVLFVIAIIIFFGVTVVFQISDRTIELITLEEFLSAACTAIPLWIAGVSIANMLLFAFRDKKKAFISFAVLIVILPRICMFLAGDYVRLLPFSYVCKGLITPEFAALPYFYTKNPLKDLILGVVYTLISSGVGILLYNKKEVDL